jgi:signal transduction histidine kinase
MGEDVTRRQQIEEQKTAFFSVASHELRTPITTIKLLLDFIEARQKPLFTKVKELQLLDREVERLDELVGEMLDISRVETGKLTMQFEQVDIDALIQEVIEKMRFMAGGRAIRYAQVKRCLAKGDRKRLEQVLTNLLTNAMKYSPDRSEIVVETKTRQNRIVVLVKDQGIGIPKNKVAHIFDRFYQVNTAGKQGFGLGLYICKQIMKQHHGSILVKTELGKGSTFSISIPSAASTKPS